MATEVQNGLAYIHGIRGDVGIEGYASITLDSVKASHKFKLDAIEDAIGFTAALIATDAHTEVDVTFLPAGGSRAGAEAGAAFITPLKSVTLSGFSVAEINGKYVYVGDASIDLSNKQGKMTLKLRRYDDAAQNDSLTTTVS